MKLLKTLLLTLSCVYLVSCSSVLKEQNQELEKEQQKSYPSKNSTKKGGYSSSEVAYTGEENAKDKDFSNSKNYPFLRNRKYLYVYSSKTNTIVPSLIMPRFLEFRVGYNKDATKESYFIEYFNPYLNRDIFIPLEHNYFLECFTRKGKRYVYKKNLTSRSHQCYITKSQLNLVSDNHMKDSLRIMARPSIHRIALIHQKDRSYAHVMLRKKDPGYMIFYDIYLDRKYLSYNKAIGILPQKRLTARKESPCLSLCQAQERHYRGKNITINNQADTPRDIQNDYVEVIENTITPSNLSSKRKEESLFEAQDHVTISYDE